MLLWTPANNPWHVVGKWCESLWQSNPPDNGGHLWRGNWKWNCLKWFGPGKILCKSLKFTEKHRIWHQLLVWRQCWPWRLLLGRCGGRGVSTESTTFRRSTTAFPCGTWSPHTIKAVLCQRLWSAWIPADWGTSAFMRLCRDLADTRFQSPYDALHFFEVDEANTRTGMAGSSRQPRRKKKKKK